MVPDLDPDKPDPDPVWPDLDPAISGSGSGLPGSKSGNIRIWIRLLPDLDPVAARSKVPHGLYGPVQALPWGRAPPPLTWALEEQPAGDGLAEDAGVPGVGPAQAHHQGHAGEYLG